MNTATLTADQRAELERRHGEVYGERLAPFEADWVTDRVLAGRNCLTAWDVHQLVTDNHITHVLDLREEHEWTPPRVGVDQAGAGGAPVAGAKAVMIVVAPAILSGRVPTRISGSPAR
jgi:hypothetical protein